MKPRISMITLGVDDLERSVRFYRDGLGFPQLESSPGVAFFTLNGTWLGLYGRAELAQDATVAAAGEGFNSFSIAHNLASEEEVDAAMSEAYSCGCNFGKNAPASFLGRIFGLFQGSRWPSLGARLQPLRMDRSQRRMIARS